MGFDPQPGVEQDRACLSAALAWLRARLAQDDEAWPEAEERYHDSLIAEPAPALARVQQRFGLTDFERDVLVLCAAMEMDPAMGALCARAHDDLSKPYPTFALALTAFDEPHWDALSPERPLRRWRLIETIQAPAQPLISGALRADERIVNALRGLHPLDERLAVLMAPAAMEQLTTLANSHLSAADAAVRALASADDGSRAPVVHLLGADSESKLVLAGHLCLGLGLKQYRLPVELLPTHPADLDLMARLWQRECLLSPVALYLDARDLATPVNAAEGMPDRFSDTGLHTLRHFLSRISGAVFLDTRDALRRLDAEIDTLCIDVDKPSTTEQRDRWRMSLDGADPGGQLATQLAGQFSLSLSAIEHIAGTAGTDGVGGRDHAGQRVWQACLNRTRPQLDQLAQRITPKATWDDIVLPDETVRLLGQIAAQVRQRGKVYGDWGFADRLNRGLGITALFAGDSGTGKTMAAEVIANDLRLNLYRIDLSAVVSKYIGETEKNLRRLFDAAEDGGAILLFDEADALFGKRSEVKDSHDRYANIEVNYLLQRMEAYRGLAVLATNQRNALDDAFMRRLRFVVQFPYPGPRERAVIWRKSFPAQTPVAELDLDRLAKFNLSGGNIQGIALNAAFLAAEDGAPVTMAHVLAALRTEFVKLERVVSEAEFRV